VYAVGHAGLTPLAEDLAAVLACGPGAALSHGSAAALLGLLPRPDGPVHVSRPGARHRRSPGIVLLRPKQLPPPDLLTRCGRSGTTAARTLLDLATAATDRDLRRAPNEAQVLRLVSRDALRSRATGRLRERLDDGSGFTRSEAERRLLASSPAPACRARARTSAWAADAVWPAQRLVAEFDGYGAHSTRAAFERDRVEDAELRAAGYRVLRVTGRRLTRAPQSVVALTAAALSSRR